MYAIRIDLSKYPKGRRVKHGKVWVKENEAGYGAVRDRKVWDTLLKARKAIHEDWEKIVEVEV